MPAFPAGAGTLEILQDRAIRPMIPLAGVGKLLERVAHRPHLSDFGFEFGDMLKGYPLDLGAFPILVPPQADEVLDTFEAETQCASPLHETQDVHFMRPVNSVPCCGSAHLRYQPDPFIVPDELGIDAGCLGGLANIHDQTLLRRGSAVSAMIGSCSRCASLPLLINLPAIGGSRTFFIGEPLG